MSSWTASVAAGRLGADPAAFCAITANWRAASGYFNDRAEVVALSAPTSSRPLRSGVPVKVRAVCGRCDEAGANRESAKPLPRFALGRIGGEDWVQLCDDGGMVEVFRIELGEP